MNVYACSDLHGMYDLYQQIKDFIKPEDIIYCLGDCGDRGPDGWKIITEIINNPQWIYLKGNHEDMLAKAIKSNHKDFCFSEEQELLYYNGGRKTYENWEINTNWDTSWGNKLSNLPYKTNYVNTFGNTILLSHSGYNPKPEEERSKPYTEHDFLWNRNHMKTSVWCGKENEYIVHGHTPTPFAQKGRNRPDLLRIENYCEGHKINLDLASWYTGVACLFNLDTFEEHYFYTEPLKI